MPRIRVELRWISNQTVRVEVPDARDKDAILEVLVDRYGTGTLDAAEIIEIDGQPANIQLCEQEE